MQKDRPSCKPTLLHQRGGKIRIQNMFHNIFFASRLAKYSDFSQNGLVSWVFGIKCRQQSIFLVSFSLHPAISGLSLGIGSRVNRYHFTNLNINIYSLRNGKNKKRSFYH